MTRVEVRPELLHWARERAGLSAAMLARRFQKLEAGERREAQQLEAFAGATCTPVVFLFFQKPPVEKIPIPDFRTADNAGYATSGRIRVFHSVNIERGYSTIEMRSPKEVLEYE